NLCALRLWTWLIAACAVLCAPALVAADQKQVLVLYSTRRDAQIAVVRDRELPNTLEAGLQQALDYYSKYLDRGPVLSDGCCATSGTAASSAARRQPTEPMKRGRGRSSADSSQN